MYSWDMYWWWSSKSTLILSRCRYANRFWGEWAWYVHLWQLCLAGNSVMLPYFLWLLWPLVFIMALVIILAPRSCYGPFVKSGPYDFHEPIVIVILAAVCLYVNVVVIVVIAIVVIVMLVTVLMLVGCHCVDGLIHIVSCKLYCMDCLL